MPFRLAALAEGSDILLDKPIIFVGRHQECDVKISSRKISRRHCCIAQVNDHLVVRDLFSTNGVRINGVRVEEGNLNIGDELCIANFRFQVSIGPAEAQPVIGQEIADDQPAQVLAPDSPGEDVLDEPIALGDDGGQREAPTERALIVPISSEHELPAAPEKPKKKKVL